MKTIRSLALSLAFFSLLLGSKAFAEEAEWVTRVREQWMTLENRTVKELAELIEKAAVEKFRRAGPQSNPYDAYTELASQNPRWEVATDSIWSVEIPNENDATIWNTLSVNERVELVGQMMTVMDHGRYDKSFEVDGYHRSLFEIISLPGDEAVTALIESALAWWELPSFRSLFPGPNAQRVFRALPFLGGAASGELRGVCRHSNVALAALMIELGLPPRDAGLYTTDTHMAFAARLIPDKWHRFDFGPDGKPYVFPAKDPEERIRGAIDGHEVPYVEIYGSVMPEVWKVSAQRAACKQI